MTRTILFCLALLTLLGACNKKSENNTVTVEYQAFAANSSKLDITYNNVVGNKIVTSAKDAWDFQIPNPTKPFTAYLKAESSSPFSSVTTSLTVNIVVNGSIVKTLTTTSNTIAVAEIEFVIQ